MPPAPRIATRFIGSPPMRPPLELETDPDRSVLHNTKSRRTRAATGYDAESLPFGAVRARCLSWSRQTWRESRDGDRVVPVASVAPRR